MIDRRMWIRMEQWYHSLHRLQQWAFKITLAFILVFIIVIVTREPSERPRQARIILDCYEGCGVDPERAISYNEYIARKEQQQRTWVANRKQELRQEIWNDNGRARWCRNHPQDRNCR
jgi:hypothetical protein